MSSRMMKSKIKRRKKVHIVGKRRKRKNRNKGTTPKFPVHVDE